MSKRARLVALVGLASLALVGLFPPWVGSIEYISFRGGVPISKQQPLGHRFLVSPPKATDVEVEEVRGTLPDPVIGVRIDTSRLLVNAGVVVTVTAVAMLLLSMLPVNPGATGRTGAAQVLFGRAGVRAREKFRRLRRSENAAVLGRGTAGLVLTIIATVAYASFDERRSIPLGTALRVVVAAAALSALWLNVTFLARLQRVTGAFGEVLTGLLVVGAVVGTLVLIGVVGASLMN